jgi:hypothetical protein
MEYEDFAIQIAPKQDEAYPVAVESPPGEGRSSIPLPFTPEQVGRTLTSLGQVVRGGAEEPSRNQRGQPR